MRFEMCVAVICCCTALAWPAWAGEGSLLDENKVTQSITEKLLDSTEIEGHYVAIATTDADQDADEDILLVDDLGNVRIMLNERNGKFAKPEWVAGPVNESPGSVTGGLSDVDLDNDEDLLVASTLGAVYLVRAEGKGRYRKMEKISDELNPKGGLVHVRVSDVDLDNDEDVVLANVDAVLYKIENVGMGNFGRASMMVQLPNIQGGLFDFVFTDLDFDNDEEIVFIDGKGNVYLLENLRGRFAAPKHIAGPFKADPGKVDIEISDYDYDGDDDLVIMGAAGVVVLLENEGNGAFASELKQIAPPLGPEGGNKILALSDVDSEMSEDFAVVNTKGWVFLIENDGDGVYGEPRCVAENIALSGVSASVVREDMNGDGAEDTLILDGAGDLYLVLGEYNVVEDRARDLGDDL